MEKEQYFSQNSRKTLKTEGKNSTSRRTCPLPPSQVVLRKSLHYTPLCLARHPSQVYYWKLSIAHKMYCWEIFWKPISRSLFLIGLPYWKIEGHSCVRRLLWFQNWFTWHFISTWKDEKLFCSKKASFFFQDDQPSIQTQTSLYD